MLNLAEYRSRPDRLADHLPWAALVAPGIVLNKDGGFQRSFAFRGPDLESSTEAELVATSARVNNVLRRFGSGWALFFDAERIEALGYPECHFPDPASALVDKERQASFEGERDHYESRFHLTLVWLPPADAQAGAERAFVEKAEPERGRDWREALAAFTAETDRAFDLFSALLPEMRALGDEETLTFLHSAISERRHSVTAPATPVYLDALLADTPLTGGLEPVLGGLHLRTISLLGFPAITSPGLLDALNHQDLGYRWSTRFIPLDKSEASRALTRLRRQWFNKRKSVTALLREVMYNQPAQLIDSDADNKVADADLALQALGADYVSFGYLTTTVTVAGATGEAADEKIRLVERVVNGLGFTCLRERVNAVEAWLSSLPGHVYANVRQPLVHSLNLAHLMPLSSVWAGPSLNRHLGGPPLLFAETSGSTPFRLSTHVGDVGHMLVVGPTGAGKSVLLSLIAMQFRRYPQARVFMFDKGWSARASVLAMGGAHHALGAAAGEEALAFQPLRRVHEAAERSWAAEWIASLVAHEKIEVTPEVKDAIWSALLSLSSAPAEERTLTGLSLLMQSNRLKSALQPYTLEGPFGALLDASIDELALRDVHCFETEALMNQQSAIFPVLTYLFHRLEERFDGRPTLLVLDEAWVFLDHPFFAARIREWLKVLRKKNVAVVFATQSLADIVSSSIAPAIIESCPQRIFLPNERAGEPASREAYQRFGLNPRQVELIATATPKRDYYLQSRRGNRLFDLKLGPIARALCASSDPDTQRLIDSLLAEGGREAFARRFLESRGLAWAAALIGRTPTSQGAKMMKPFLLTAAAALGAVPMTLVVEPAPASAMPVFDATNYSQNLLQAARALEQINHQVQSLQNEATMLQNMAKNLERIDFPQLRQMKAALGQIDQLMAKAQSIDFNVDTLDQRFKEMFPGSVEQALHTDQRVADARARLDGAMEAFGHSMSVQARVVANVQQDSQLLDDLVGRSQSAEGALQAQQATNQLLALSAKQQLQLQDLLAAEFHSAAIERARSAQSEAEARAATTRFLGSGKAYSNTHE